VYFNFLHRFTESGAPDHKVTNVPTFLVATGIAGRALVGFNYATNSNLAPRYPNEWEYFARAALFLQDLGAPIDLVGQGGYNLAAEGLDGELTLARRQGPVRVIAAGRVLSDPFESGGTRVALAGGTTIRVSRWVALAGDAATLLDRERGERVAWSAGVHIALPNTPHSLSLHAANTNTATLQGSSRGSEDVRYGFEFTIPITLRRYFGGGRAAAPPQPAPQPAPADSAQRPAAGTPAGAEGRATTATIRNFAYLPARLEVAAGTTVEWRNEDQVAHTVTATGGGFSSPLIQPGERWRFTFTAPGTYDYFCTPHPFMKGVVVVR
jgi:plastocyanin